MISPKGAREECIFCVAARGGVSRDTLTLARTENAVVMLNRYPYTNGHVMVAPVEHEARLYDTDEAILGDLMRVTAHAQRLLADHYHADGFNVGMNFGEAAGAGIADHYHIHIVPRWSGDSNFMSVTANTRIVPEDLEDTWERLAPAFESF